MKVYLAGKIGKNDWRHDIFRDLRNVEPYKYDGYKPVTELTNGHFAYTGPFFLSDDHGSYHGESKHGRGVGMLENPIYPDNKPDSSKTVVRKCFEWIDKSDILFVWLNAEDAYGTIVEMGYAKAKNKVIFLVIDKHLMHASFMKDIWFARTMADYVYFEESAEKGWALFAEKFALPDEKAPFAYITNKQDKTWIHTKISEFTNRLASDHSVEALNALDRQELTTRFMRNASLQYRSFAVFLESERLHADIAEEIDYKIVRGYYKNQTKKEAKDLQSWEIKGTGLHYHFDQNYEKEKKSNQEKKTYTPETTINASPSQINYLSALLKKNCYDLTIPINLLNIHQASNLISHFVNDAVLDEAHQKLLIEQKPNEFSGTMKATGIVERLKRIFEKEIGLTVTIPLHTKCKYYFEDVHVLKEGSSDGEYIIQNEFGEYEYTEKWLNLLVETLSDQDKYADLKKYKKGMLRS